MMTKGKQDRALRALKKIADINGKEISPKVWDGLRSYAERSHKEANKEKDVTMFSLLKMPRKNSDADILRLL